MQELHFQTVPIPAGILIVAETGLSYNNWGGFDPGLYSGERVDKHG